MKPYVSSVLPVSESNGLANAVLGIDAAWTTGNRSGLALVEKASGRWQVVRSAPSHEAFVADAHAAERTAAGHDEVTLSLLRAKRLLGGKLPAVVAVDMPLSPRPITRRREAERKVSRAFGGYGCSTHSPNPTRPGLVAVALHDGLCAMGYRLAVGQSMDGAALIEVFPLLALLGLMPTSVGVKPKRTLYKVGKRRSLGATSDERLKRLHEVWCRIREELGSVIDAIPRPGPAPPMGGTLKYLKACEDELDAIICCYVGIAFLEGRASGWGDPEGVIWAPSAVDRLAKSRTTPSIP